MPECQTLDGDCLYILCRGLPAQELHTSVSSTVSHTELQADCGRAHGTFINSEFSPEIIPFVICSHNSNQLSLFEPCLNNYNGVCLIQSFFDLI